jgi:hypothetical protein
VSWLAATMPSWPTRRHDRQTPTGMRRRPDPSTWSSWMGCPPQHTELQHESGSVRRDPLTAAVLRVPDRGRDNGPNSAGAGPEDWRRCGDHRRQSRSPGDPVELAGCYASARMKAWCDETIPRGPQRRARVLRYRRAAPASVTPEPVAERLGIVSGATDTPLEILDTRQPIRDGSRAPRFTVSLNVCVTPGVLILTVLPSAGQPAVRPGLQHDSCSDQVRRVSRSPQAG